MKLLIIQLSPTSCHILPLRSIYSPQHPVLKTLILHSSLKVRYQGSHSCKTMDESLHFQTGGRKTKYSELNGSKNFPNLICSYFPAILICHCHTKISELLTFFKVSLAIFISRLCPAFWLREVDIHCVVPY